MTDERTPTLRKRMKLRATVGEVWAALTVPEELVRWFPLQARVEPGVGGSITQSWNAEYEGSANILEWDPGKRLTTARTLSLPTEEGTIAEVTITEEWTFEARGGAVHLHLEQGGFPEGSAGQEWMDACSRGWDFELRGLRHALERHCGTPRKVLWCRRLLDLPLESIWDRVMGSGGFAGAGTLPAIKHGDRYEVEPARGPKLAGCLQLYLPPRDFAATVEGVEDAYLRLRLDPPGFGVEQAQLHLWLSTFGVSEDRRESVREEWEAMLDELFPDQGQD